MSAIPTLIQRQRTFFNTGNTYPVTFRIEQLKHLKQAILKHQHAIAAAAKADLGRPEFEAYFEMGVMAELNLALKRLKKWVKPKRVAPQVEHLPATAWIQPEPLGVILVIAPWNYPFQLMISPLIGTIAAGNCTILKPSELAPKTSQVITTLIKETFDSNYVAVVEGGVKTSQQLLAEKFDHIFFTGGPQVGRIVMAAAAEHLTPITLELGGKSPCIVDVGVRLDYTAKRIAWGKFINAGQTCLAPDYLVVDRRIKSDLIKHLQQAIHAFFGEDPVQSPDFARIVNDRHFFRLQNLLSTETPVIGGQTIPEERYIAPTVIDRVSWDSPIMEDEIFGPILPVLQYDDIDEAISQIKIKPKPLAFYLFSNNPQIQDKVLHSSSSGTICFNDTVLQFGAWNLPFGGVGTSGIGKYHGQASFDTFSNQKSVLKRHIWPDLPMRYPPYRGKLGLLKKFLGMG